MISDAESGSGGDDRRKLVSPLDEPPCSSERIAMNDLRTSSAFFVSVDRQVTAHSRYCAPDRYRDLHKAVNLSEPLIGRGAGLSYVAASFDRESTSISMTHFNRILRFDPARMEVEVEAGMAVGKLSAFLAEHMLYLPVQPGYPQITVGGCIAGNVHGKNQYRDGLFSDWIISLRLLHPAHGELECSRAENFDVFDLTCGGLGLTGIVLAATLRLKKLPSRGFLTSTEWFSGLRAAFDVVEQKSKASDSVFAWIDLSQGPTKGSGLVCVSNFDEEASGTFPPLKWRGMRPERSSWRRVPLFGSPTFSALLNAVYGFQLARTATRSSLFQMLFPSLGKEFYYDLFGKAGFVELQCLVPSGCQYSFIDDFGRLLDESSLPVALATIKAARRTERQLDFSGDGFIFSIDVAMNRNAPAFLERVDRICMEHSAKPNVMKYAGLTSSGFRKFYPDAERFRDRLKAFDRSRHFRSALSRRLEL